MRIWHLLSNRWNSAITEYALSAARAVELEGHVSLFTPLNGSPAAQRAKDMGLKTSGVNQFMWRHLSSLKRVAADFQPEVVMSYGGPEAFLAPWAMGKTNPLFVRFRGQDLPRRSFLTDFKQKYSLRNINLVLTPSEILARNLRARGLHSAVRSITLGCDTQRYFRSSSLDRGMQTAEGSRPEIVIFGRFDPVKGHREFMGVFARVVTEAARNKTPRPLMHIVGQAANLSGEDLRQSAKLHGLTEGSDFHITEQRIADVAGLMSRASLGVVPSIGSELICRVAEEFLLCGTPVIVSGVGSLAEVLRDPTFGASYEGMDEDAAARLVGTWCHRSWHESEAAKQARAEQAKGMFSLQAMGRVMCQEISLAISKAASRDRS